MKRKEKFKAGQVVMIIKGDKIGLPEPATFMRYSTTTSGAVWISYGGLSLELREGLIRPLTKRERGGK